MNQPLVSAVMPTRGRREYAAQALESYLAQTWDNRELLILDDEDDPSFDWLTEPGIRYERSSSRLIPLKRNELCRLARGEIIVNFDSDDWSAPARIADQVGRLQDTGRAVTAYNRILFVVDDDAVFEYRGCTNCGSGTSLAYLRSWWETHPYNESVTLSTDMRFISVARDNGELVCAPARDLMVARIHADNSNPKQARPPSFIGMTRDALPELFNRDLRPADHFQKAH